MRQVSERPALLSAARLTLAVSLAALVAGCSSDARRFAPAPWSSAERQHTEAFGQGWGARSQGQAEPEATGAIARTPPAVQSQALPPVGSTAQAHESWTPPPSRLAAVQDPPPEPSNPSRMTWQQGPAPANEGARGRSAAPAAPARATAHTVRQGESLVGIARQYGVSPAELAATNHLGPADRIRVGQSLTIPTAGTTVAAAAPALAPERRGASDPATTASIQPAARVETARPAAMPEAPPARQQAARQPSAPAASPPPTAQAAAPAPAPVPAQTQASAPPPAREQAAPRNQIASADPRSMPEPERMTSAEFRWPVRGRVVTNFGRQPGGGMSDGIAIAVPQGTPVKAAENGVVAYAGNELRGYGNLVLIRHEGDWVTAYAHNSELLVRRGDTVRRGQVIAKAGQTGNVSQPQLHFEIRRGSAPVNPVDHLTGS